MKNVLEGYQKMGIPDEISEGGSVETYIIGFDLPIQVLYENQECINIK